jgi:hypothetical protein
MFARIGEMGALQGISRKRLLRRAGSVPRHIRSSDDQDGVRDIGKPKRDRPDHDLAMLTEKFADVGNPRLSIAYSFKRQRREAANYSWLNLLFDRVFPRWPSPDDCLLEGMMKHQLQIGTERGIVSREAVKQIRILITDLARTVQILDADIVAEEMRPRADDLVFTLDTRRHNLMVTIASLEDRLDSIEKVRSRGYGGRANSALPRTRAASPRSAGSSI